MKSFLKDTVSENETDDDESDEDNYTIGYEPKTPAEKRLFEQARIYKNTSRISMQEWYSSVNNSALRIAKKYPALLEERGMLAALVNN